MRYRWRLPDPSPEDINCTRELAQAISVPESIASILVRRGIRTFNEARDFFRPSLEALHAPELMDGMQDATARVIQAVRSGERIAVYGDYDVDGTTSTAMMTLFLRSLGANVAYHIPDRFTEGYGLTTSGLDRLIATEPSPSLLITIDCGVTAVDAVQYARDRGLEVIICDHHEPGPALPNANAILNPLKPGCPYPNKQLCGCGVAFKLVQSIAANLGRLQDAYEYLDFVALASSADIVSLLGENRILVYYGLQHINTRPRAGIKALIEGAGMKTGKLGTTQIVFGLAPRINAAGRLGDGGRSVDLMMAQTEAESQQVASVLEEENVNRRRIDEEAFLEACGLVDGMLDRQRDRIIVLHNGTWHAGVIGIVASRLVERYHLPVVLMTTIDGVAKGSARSIAGFDIHSALKSCEHLLVTFGGHKYAAGVSVQIERVTEFRLAINDYATGVITAEMLEPEIAIDAEIDMNELTPRYFAIVRQLAPFGPDNHRPMFLTRGVQAVGYPRTVGRNSAQHLKFNVRSSHKPAIDSQTARDMASNNIPFTTGGGAIDAIGFGMGGRIGELSTEDRKLRDNLDLVYALDENEFAGRVTPQLVVRDFR